MDEVKKMSKAQLIFIVAVIGITCALFYTFGDNGLYALFALLFGLGKNKKKAEDLIIEADEHEEMANHIVKEAEAHKETAEEIQDDITKIVHDDVIDLTKPIDEVVDNLHEDLN